MKVSKQKIVLISLLISFFVFGIANVVRAQQTSTYKNSEFGFSLDYPADWHMTDTDSGKGTHYGLSVEGSVLLTSKPKEKLNFSTSSSFRLLSVEVLKRKPGFSIGKNGITKPDGTKHDLSLQEGWEEIVGLSQINGDGWQGIERGFEMPDKNSAQISAFAAPSPDSKYVYFLAAVKWSNSNPILPVYKKAKNSLKIESPSKGQDDSPEYSGQGKLVRARNSNRVYEIIDGKKHWLPSPNVLKQRGYGWDNLQKVSKKTLNKYPRVKLFSPVKSNKVYYLTRSGMIRHIPTAKVFNSYNNKWKNVVSVTKEEIETYKKNKLIHKGNSPKIFLLKNGKKHWIKSPKVFEKRGYSWGEVAPVNKVEFETYPTGEPIGADTDEDRTLVTTKVPLGEGGTKHKGEFYTLGQAKLVRVFKLSRTEFNKIKKNNPEKLDDYHLKQFEEIEVDLGYADKDLEEVGLTGKKEKNFQACRWSNESREWKSVGGGHKPAENKVQLGATKKGTYVACKKKEEGLSFSETQVEADSIEDWNSVNESLAYVAGEGEENYVAYQGQELGTQYEEVDLPMEIGNSLAYVASDNDKQFIVLDGNKRREYDAVSAPKKIGGKLCYQAIESTGEEANQKEEFIVCGGEEKQRYDEIVHGKFFEVSGKLAYFARDGEEKFIMLGGEKRGENHNIFDPRAIDGKLTYRATKIQATSVETFIVHGGDKFGQQYENVHSAFGVKHKLGYIAKEGNKDFVVVGGEKISKGYENILKPTVIDGEVAFVVSKKEEEFVVFGGSKHKNYKAVDELNNVGGKLAYNARKEDQWVIVYGNKEYSKNYSYCYPPLEVGGKLVFFQISFDGENQGRMYIVREQ